MNPAAMLRNIAAAGWRRSAKLIRDYRKRTRRRLKRAEESAKHARAEARRGRTRVRHELQHAYAGTVKTTRYWDRVRRRTLPAIALEASIRRELRKAAAGDGPIIVGPWLSEVGYEALYWVPFIRWFADHYGVDRSRLVVVSRGGVGSWYAGVCGRYVELLDLFEPGDFAARLEHRRQTGDQKQIGMAAFDAEIVDRVRAVIGAPAAAVCHPSAMFRLMRHFWLGTDSLQQVIDHTRYVPLTAAAGVRLPDLPERFAAVKFYTGRALPDVPATRAALRAIVSRISRDMPVVALHTGIVLDEHEDYLFKDIPGVIAMAQVMTPQNNLAVQTEVIRRAALFAGTCGGVAWLAPMLGTPTVAVYADDHFLAPHLYAARQVYAGLGAAAFTPVDVRALQFLDVTESIAEWIG
jgi:hypothetical protein